MNVEAWVALGSAGGTLIGAAATALVLIFNARSKNRLDELSQAFDQQQKVITGLQEQVSRHESHAQEMAAALAAQQEAHADCREETAEWRQWGQFVFAGMRRMAAALKAAGLPYEDPPDPPAPRPGRAAREAAADFAVRTVQQNAAQMKAVDDRLKSQTPPPPTQPPGGT